VRPAQCLLAYLISGTGDRARPTSPLGTKVQIGVVAAAPEGTGVPVAFEGFTVKRETPRRDLPIPDF
jgi:regulation of enolase protein 1 (concanavalin A-like superfamily)